MAYCDNDKVRTISCLDEQLAAGLLATLPSPKYGHLHSTLLAVRPDRLLVGLKHSGIRLVEVNQNANIFLLPAPTTRPALLLEAMVANAICVGGKESASTAILRTVIEKFGRKAGSITHGDDEGIGNVGAGLTPRTLEMLKRYGLSQAASWLLTGTTLFDRSANTKILPPWLPTAPKGSASLNTDAFLHVLASGDPYFSEYIKDPDQKMPSVLPRQSDASSYIAQDFARTHLQRGDVLGALKLYDVSGAESCDETILQLVLALNKSRSSDASKSLDSMCGYTSRGIATSGAPLVNTSSFAALALAIKESPRHQMDQKQIARWMKPLAPSIQNGARTLTRSRQRLFGDAELIGLPKSDASPPDPFWVSPCNESKHVW
jgi:hypothetical protein